MNWSTTVGVAASACVVLAACLGILRWIIIHEVRTVKDQFKANGGTSFRDHVDWRLDKQDDELKDLGQRVATIEGALGVSRK